MKIFNLELSLETLREDIWDSLITVLNLRLTIATFRLNCPHLSGFYLAHN